MSSWDHGRLVRWQPEVADNFLAGLDTSLPGLPGLLGEPAGSGACHAERSQGIPRGCLIPSPEGESAAQRRVRALGGVWWVVPDVGASLVGALSGATC